MVGSSIVGVPSAGDSRSITYSGGGLQREPVKRRAFWAAH